MNDDRPTSLKDRELHIVRELIEETQAAQGTARVTGRQTPIADRNPDLPGEAHDGCPPAQGRFAQIAGRLTDHRPERKTVLLTGLVCVLLLKPWMALGAIAAVLALIAAAFAFWGADRFWQTVIRTFRRYETRYPVKARRLKLRAYVLARKWDAWLTHLPDRIESALQSPDLRAIAAADARHDAVLSARLSRLG